MDIQKCLLINTLNDSSSYRDQLQSDGCSDAEHSPMSTDTELSDDDEDETVFFEREVEGCEDEAVYNLEDSFQFSTSFIAGNFVNEDILGSLEFACKLAGSKLIVIMGHTSCGAVKGACDHAELGNLTGMLKKIQPAMAAVKTEDGVDRSSKNLDFVNKVAVKNVHLTIDKLKSDSPILNEMIEAGDVEIVGAMYDVKSGSVSFL